MRLLSREDNIHVPAFRAFLSYRVILDQHFFVLLVKVTRTKGTASAHFLLVFSILSKGEDKRDLSVSRFCYFVVSGHPYPAPEEIEIKR
jgi:hypothetical protein